MDDTLTPTPEAEMPQHPFQPLYVDRYGTLRFKENAIVRFLLDNGGYDMNKLALMDFDDEDRAQFAQLTGYSTSGFAELTNYVSDEVYAAATLEDPEIAMHARRAYVLREKLDAVKAALQEPIAELFGIHPDDLPLDK